MHSILFYSILFYSILSVECILSRMYSNKKREKRRERIFRYWFPSEVIAISLHHLWFLISLNLNGVNWLGFDFLHWFSTHYFCNSRSVISATANQDITTIGKGEYMSGISQIPGTYQHSHWWSFAFFGWCTCGICHIPHKHQSMSHLQKFPICI